MTDETLKKANILKDEIIELNIFISDAEHCWSKLSFIKKRKRIIKHRGYGYFNSGEYELSDELSIKILDVMKQHLSELREEYKRLGVNESGEE